MLVRNLGVTNKEHYGMSWYFLEWSIEVPTFFFPFVVPVDYAVFSVSQFLGKKPLAPRALRFLVTYKLSKVALGTRMLRIYFDFFSLALFPFSLSLYSQNEILAGFQQRDKFNL